jgi:hypothetical protein
MVEKCAFGPFYAALQICRYADMQIGVTSLLGDMQY